MAVRMKKTVRGPSRLPVMNPGKSLTSRKQRSKKHSFLALTKTPFFSSRAIASDNASISRKLLLTTAAGSGKVKAPRQKRAWPSLATRITQADATASSYRTAVFLCPAHGIALLGRWCAGGGNPCRFLCSGSPTRTFTALFAFNDANSAITTKQKEKTA